MSRADKPVSAVATVDGYTQDGMTLLEHYAGLAMQGMLANVGILEQAGLDVTKVAVDAIDYAQALIAELEKASL